RNHDRWCDGPDVLASWEFEVDRRGDADRVPRVGEPEDILGGRHHVDHQTGVAVAPAADNGLVHGLFEPALAQALGQLLNQVSIHDTSMSPPGAPSAGLGRLGPWR